GRVGRGQLRPPPRQARYHRLGADQWLARRDRHPREDPAPRRARPLLHRELVGAVRPPHPGEDAARSGQDRERLLMPATPATSVAGPLLATQSLRAPLLCLMRFSAPFVFID